MRTSETDPLTVVGGESTRLLLPSRKPFYKERTMGAELSTTVSQRLQRSTIDELLREEQMVEKLATAIPSLSTKSRSNLNSLKAKLSQSHDRPNAKSLLQTAKLKHLLDVTAKDVGLSKTIYTEFLDWLDDWQVFLKSENIVSCASESFTSLLAEKYELTYFMEKRRITDRYRWRFFTLFFYDLHLLVSDNGSNTTRGSEKLVRFLSSSSIEHDEEIICSNIKRWVATGLRYHTLCVSSASSGCLFMLPESISDKVWEEYLPIKGPTHEEAVALLKNTSIKKKCDDARASDLAETIRKGLLEPIKWHYSRVTDDMPSFGTTQHSERRTRKRKQTSDHTRPMRQDQRHPPTQPQPQPSQNTPTPGTHLQLLSTVAAGQQSNPQSLNQVVTGTFKNTSQGQGGSCEKGTQDEPDFSHDLLRNQNASPAAMDSIAASIASSGGHTPNLCAFQTQQPTAETHETAPEIPRAPAPLCKVPQTGYPQEDHRAPLDLLTLAAIQQMPATSQDQSNITNPGHNDFISRQPGVPGEQAATGPAVSLNLGFTRLMSNQSIGDQDSRNICESARYISGQTPWSNAVNIPQTDTNPADVWDNAFNIPLNQATPSDNWNQPGWDNAFNISSPNQATAPNNWNHPGWDNAFSIPFPNQAPPPDNWNQPGWDNAFNIPPPNQANPP